MRKRGICETLKRLATTTNQPTNFWSDHNSLSPSAGSGGFTCSSWDLSQLPKTSDHANCPQDSALDYCLLSGCCCFAPFSLSCFTLKKSPKWMIWWDHRRHVYLTLAICYRPRIRMWLVWKREWAKKDDCFTIDTIWHPFHPIPGSVHNCAKNWTNPSFLPHFLSAAGDNLDFLIRVSVCHIQYWTLLQ